MACTRRSIRNDNVARGHTMPIWCTSLGGYAPVPGPNEENGLPLPRHTSSARSTRRRLDFSIRDAASGSSACNRENSTSTSDSYCSCSRISGHSPGSCRSSITAVRYNPVPATNNASAPAAAIAVRAAAACVLKSATVNRASGPTRSRQWCGTAARSAAVGLAVPMSMPRYTCMASTATMWAPVSRATAIATSLLPLAVGATIATWRMLTPRRRRCACGASAMR